MQMIMVKKIYIFKAVNKNFFFLLKKTKTNKKPTKTIGKENKKSRHG